MKNDVARSLNQMSGGSGGSAGSGVRGAGISLLQVVEEFPDAPRPFSRPLCFAIGGAPGSSTEGAVA